MNFVNFIKQDEYLEFSAPLRQHYRRWWNGTGRIWLIVLILVGLVSIASLWQAYSLGTGTGFAWQFFLSAGSGALMPVLATLIACLAGRSFQHRLSEITQEAALPASPAVSQLRFLGAVHCGLPPLYAFLILLIAHQTVSSAFRVESAAWSLSAFAIIQQILLPLIPTIVVFFVCLAVNARPGGNAASLILLTIYLVINLYQVIIPAIGLISPAMSVPIPFASLNDYSITFLFPVIGLILACSLLAMLLLKPTISMAFRRAQALMVLLALSSLAVMPTSIEVLASNPLGLMLAELAFGFTCTFLYAPFGFAQSIGNGLFGVPATSELYIVWIPNLSIAIPAGGYIIATLLNLIWLASVFLFCRWAVGRSAVREG